MRVVSVNLGHERILQRKDRMAKTGIFKLPIDGPIQVTKLGLLNDVIVSRKHHGGPDQAIYIYGAVDYDWWSKELGQEMEPGTFGENLTISELESTQFNIGDNLHIGDVTLQVTAPRIPCATFAARMEDSLWIKKFRRAGRPGLYCRVLKEGALQTGDTVSIETYAGETISILEMYRDYYDRNKSRETLLRHLNAPIAIRARRDVEEELEKISTE